MNKRILAVSLALLFPWPALAVDVNPGVKSTVILKTEKTWENSQIVYPAGRAEVTGLIVEIAPGAETGWHSHPVPSFAYLLEGELEIRTKNNQVKLLKAGDAIAELVYTSHNGKNVGATPVKILVFYAGDTGEPVTNKD